MEKHPVPICLDTETTGLNPRTAKVVAIQFGTLRHVYIIDCRPFYELSGASQDLWKKSLTSFIEACPLIIGHNLKFDYKMLAYPFGVKMDRLADTMLQELIIHGVGLGKAESQGIAVNMHATASRYGLKVEKEARSWFIDLDALDAWFLPFPQKQIDYMSQDITIPLQIYQFQRELLLEKELTQIADLEHACLPAIARMELDGCYVDRQRWQGIIEKKKEQRTALETNLSSNLTPIIQDLRERQYEEEKHALEAWNDAKQKIEEALKEQLFMNGMSWKDLKTQGMKVFREEYPRPKTPKLDTGPINLNSSDQLKQALSILLGVELESTDESHLTPYVKSEPLIAQLLEWKGYNQFIKTFGYSILAKIDTDQRIHPEYKQLGAGTGRMSCSVPNWQNLPSHEPDETSVRRCVIAETGNKLLTADFSNIEVRVLAEMSQDENLLAFFKKDGDLHSTTARLMFGLSEDIDPKKAELKPGLAYRSVAKTINFGLVYGMGVQGLADTLGIPLEDARDLFNKYFEAYPGVANWLETTSEQALLEGYSLTIAGRKRFYDLPSEPRYDRDTMEWDDFIRLKQSYNMLKGRYTRQAKNAPVQGTSADITKHALALLYKHMPAYVKIVACVHDEICVECPEEKASVVAQLLATAMYKACKIYLQTVYIPPIVVAIENYWSKE
jgi:DNA polymerase-1